MALLEKISDDKATAPAIKEIFEGMKQAIGAVPEPLRLLAVSPGLFELQTRLIGYYRDHQSLSPELLTCIRFAAASHFGNTACIQFNSTLLKKQGVTEAELEIIKSNPLDAPLEEKDRIMLDFVLKAVRDEKGETADMEKLHERGYSDSDILDAVNHGFAMFAPGRMLRFFGLME